MELAILLGFTAIVSLLTHWLYPKFWMAYLFAAAFSIAAGLVIIFIREHFPIAMIANLPFAIANPGLPCFAIAVVVGLPFLLHRKKKETKALPKP